MSSSSGKGKHSLNNFLVKNKDTEKVFFSFERCRLHKPSHFLCQIVFSIFALSTQNRFKWRLTLILKYVDIWRCYVVGKVKNTVKNTSNNNNQKQFFGSQLQIPSLPCFVILEQEIRSHLDIMLTLSSINRGRWSDSGHGDSKTTPLQFRPCYIVWEPRGWAPAASPRRLSVIPTRPSDGGLLFQTSTTCTLCQSLHLQQAVLHHSAEERGALLVSSSFTLLFLSNGGRMQSPSPERGGV